MKQLKSSNSPIIKDLIEKGAKKMRRQKIAKGIYGNLNLMMYSIRNGWTYKVTAEIYTTGAFTIQVDGYRPLGDGRHIEFDPTTRSRKMFEEKKIVHRMRDIKEGRSILCVPKEK